VSAETTLACDRTPICSARGGAFGRVRVTAHSRDQAVDGIAPACPLRRTDLRRQPSCLLPRRDRGVPVGQPSRHDPEDGEHARQVAEPPSFAQEVDRLSYQHVREIERAGIERGRAEQQRGLTVEGAVSDHRAELVHRSRGSENGSA
jgi:hypothetical protein